MKFSILPAQRDGAGRSRSRLTPCALATALALACIFASPAARADVIGLGDVTPAKDDPDNVGLKIPDLPIAGGAVTGGALIVGGTGQQIGGTDTGQLVIDIPAFTAPLTSNTGVIGGTAEGSGLVRIFTIGSQWRVKTQLIVGEFGQGTLELTNGGELSEDPPSPSNPTLEVIVGRELGAQGYINLSGNGSLLRSRELTIGEGGFGQMSLQTRARVSTANEAIIGDMRSGDIGLGYVTVDGQLTRWTVGGTATLPSGPGTLTVGDEGRGALTITNQGEVRISDTDAGSIASKLIIANTVGSYGEVNVDGQSSQLWSFGTIQVGQIDGARAILRVSNKGLVRANAAIGIGVDGVLEVAGGTVLTPIAVNNLGTIQTAPGSSGQIDSIVNNQASLTSRGEIRVSGTSDRVREKLTFTKQLNNSGLITSIGGEMEFTGGVSNTGMIAGRDAIYRFRNAFTNVGALSFSVGTSDVYGTVTNNGTLGVAHSTDVTFYDPVTNNGNLTVLPGGAAIFLNGLTLSSSSTLSLQLNAVASVEEIGQLQIVGTAALGGTLSLVDFPGLKPEPGDSYRLISSSIITGTFSSVIFPPAPGNNWSLTYNPTSVVLNYITAPAFDADVLNDGIVDAADLAIINANYGLSPATQAQGDINMDGVVDGDDILIWQQHLGQPSAVPAAGAVPEPGSMALVFTSLAFVFGGVRRRASLVCVAA